MNRRSFFKTLATATAGFAILPAATTYNRLWKATKVVSLGRTLYVPNPEYATAEYELQFLWNVQTHEKYSAFHEILRPFATYDKPHIDAIGNK